MDELFLIIWLLYFCQHPCVEGGSSCCKINVAREVIIRKKKVVNFHNFGPDPPPLKVVKTPIFFLLHDQKNIMCKLRKILPWKPKIVRKKSIFSWKLSKFSKYIGQGVPLPPLQKNFIADLDELEHAKKKVVKMSNFWDDPPPVVKIHNFFFSNDNLPN